MGRLVIEPLALHWLSPEVPEEDLCAHAGVRVTYDGRVLLQVEGGYAASTGALHLLRSLEPGYEGAYGFEGARTMEQLIPCCGHMMAIDGVTGVAENIGCPNGVGWGVEHLASTGVRLTFPEEGVELPFEEWRLAVLAYSSAVREFYFSGAPKAPIDEYDAEWLPVMLAEWEQRHEAARHGA